MIKLICWKCNKPVEIAVVDAEGEDKRGEEDVELDIYIKPCSCVIANKKKVNDG